jgi:hypothetical protein
MCGSKQLGKIPEPYASLVVPDFLHVSANLARAIAVIVKPRAIISWHRRIDGDYLPVRILRETHCKEGLVLRRGAVNKKLRERAIQRGLVTASSSALVFMAKAADCTA